MDYKEFLPPRALRKFDAICLHNEYLHENKALQQQILDCMADMMTEAREYWSKLHATTIDAVITEDRKAQAKKRGKARDNKYAPFREYFKNLQQQRFNEYYKQGQKMSANSFVTWFLAYNQTDIEIPYRQSNLKSKLIQLAQANNREFIKAFEC
ncbi:MAG: hypothetical protein IJS88_00390 [Alphaproteobacteria bacterium]|nr:hypothetical protein [Alphaproteobacteria bacterium]